MKYSGALVHKKLQSNLSKKIKHKLLKCLIVIGWSTTCVDLYM